MFISRLTVSIASADILGKPGNDLFSKPHAYDERNLSFSKRIPRFDFGISVRGVYANNFDINHGDIVLCEDSHKTRYFPKFNDVVLIDAATCHPEVEGIHENARCIRRVVDVDVNDLENIVVASGDESTPNTRLSIPHSSIIGKALYAFHI